MKLFFLVVIFISWLNAQNFVIKVSPYSVDETIEKLTKIVKAKGFRVFATVDHAKGAQSVKMDLEPQKVLIFGKPQAGTKIMQKDRQAGFDLPIKIMVYQEAKEVKLLYRTSEYFKSHYKLDGCKTLEKMAGALDAITNKAIGK